MVRWLTHQTNPRVKVIMFGHDYGMVDADILDTIETIVKSYAATSIVEITVEASTITVERI